MKKAVKIRSGNMHRFHEKDVHLSYIRDIMMDETKDIKDQTQNEAPQEARETSEQPAGRRPSRLEQYVGQVLSGNILTKAEVRRQYPYIFFMALLMLLYIANGYHIQKLHRRHDRLAGQVKELRARSLTVSSLRMSATRQSEILNELERRNIPLRESVTPSKVIDK